MVAGQDDLGTFPEAYNWGIWIPNCLLLPGETESISPTLSSSSLLPTWAASQNLTQRGAPESLPEETRAPSRAVWCSRKNGKALESGRLAFDFWLLIPLE